MRLKELTFIAMRIMAVYVFVRAIGYLGTTVQMWLTYNVQSTNEVSMSMKGIWTISLLPGLLFIGISLLLWNKAGAAASRIVSNKEETAEDWTGVAQGELYKFGFAIVGIVIMILTLPELIGNAAQLFQVSSSDYYAVSAPFAANVWTALLVNVVKLTLASILILRRDTIYSWLNRTAKQVRINNQ